MIDRIRKYYDGLSVVRKTAIWFSISNAVCTGFVFLTTPFFTHWMTSLEIGLFSLYTTWESLLQIFITLNLSCGVYEVYLTDYADRREQVAQSLLVLTAVVSVSFYLVYLIGRPLFNRLMRLDTLLVTFLYIDSICVAIVRFWQTRQRFEYRYKLCSVVTIFIGVSRALLGVGFVYLSKSKPVELRAAGQILPRLMLALVLLFVLLRGVKIRGITKYWRRAALFNIVLIPHYLSNIILASSDRIMIERFCNKSDVAIYSIAYTFGNLLLVILSSISSAVSPQILMLLKEKSFSGVKKMIASVSIIMAAFSILVIMIAPEVLAILGPKEYMQGAKAIPAIVFGVFLSTLYGLASNAEFYYKKNKAVTIITCGGALLNVVLNWAFIPYFGFVTAAYTTVASYALMMIAHLCVIERITKEPIFRWKTVILTVCLTATAGMLIKMVYPFPILRWGAIVVVVIFIVIKRKTVIAMAQRLMGR